MKTLSFATATFLSVSGLLLSQKGAAQITLVQSPYMQDFNDLASGLPAGWSVWTGATVTSLGTAATFTGVPFAWTSTTGGFKNLAAAAGLTAASVSTEQLASSNRALGLRPTGTLGDPGGAWVMNIHRTDGLTQFMLNFKIQSLDGSGNGRTITWRVDYAFGASPGSFVKANTVPASLTTTLSPAGWGSTQVTVDFAGALDNRTDPVWIRIAALTPSAGTGSRPSVAIDDVELSYSEVDVVPPSFLSTYPKITNVTDSGLELLTSLSETGHTYFVVLSEGSLPPGSDQVRRGEDGAGVLLQTGLSGSISAEAPSLEYRAAAATLTPATGYDVYVVAEDMLLNLQPLPVKLTCRTEPGKIDVGNGKLFLENFDSCGSVNSFTSISLAGAQGWTCTKSGMASGGIRMNGYAGRAFANEDWLISPLVRLDEASQLSFYSQVSFSGNPLQLKISVDYAGSGNPALAAWTDLPGNFPVVPVESTSTNLADWTMSTVDLTAYAGREVYVAWVYTSTSATAARWTLDSVRFVNASASFVLTSVSELSFRLPGIVKSCTVTGFDLVDDLIITVPESFEVSDNNKDFSGRLIISASRAAGPVMVYVRFKPGLPVRDHTGYLLNRSAGTTLNRILVRGADVTQTVDLTTYNLEFFGTDVRNENGTEFGPTNDALQIRNVRKVMQEIGSDIFALQEISDDNALHDLVTGLSGYTTVVSGRWSHADDPPDPNFPPQKIGFVFDTTTVSLVGSRIMFSKLYDDIRHGEVVLPDYPGGSGAFWSSGRLPFMATFRVGLRGESRTVHVIGLHAKSGTLQNDYDRREYDARVLYDTLMVYHRGENIVLLGDFNDEVEGSIREGAPTPYHHLVDDTVHFKVVTKRPGEGGTGSYLGTNSMLDHIVVSDQMKAAYVDHSAFIEEAGNYVSNYLGTTSDHLPVTARFRLAWPDELPVTITDAADYAPLQMRVYPNPVRDRMVVSGIGGENPTGHLFDSTGRSMEIMLEKSGDRFYCNTEYLPQGVYVLVMNNGSEIRVTRFLKL